MRYEIENWLTEMANKYPEIRVYSFSDKAWIEDNKGLYLAATPLSSPERISAPADQTETNCGGGLVNIRSRYFIIWRLNGITESIFNACVIEASYVGRVVAVTTDIENIFSRMESSVVPPGDREFVAIEIEVLHTITRNKTKCECLRTCMT